MKRVLGIDLGTNSLGWGIIENNQIIDCGVLIFDQGIPLEKGSESDKSPAAERTAFRAARRLKFRRRLRKYHTLKILIENGMCPLTMEDLDAWIKQGKFPLHNSDFISFLNSTKEDNPYYYRAKAATEKVEPFELGRALYHIALRRGFKSSKKDQSSANEKETSELKNAIKHLESKLISQERTLGQYLYELVKCNDKIRGVIKCGRVEHYMPEFERICRMQGISGELKQKLFDALFLQRPLRSKRFLVGKCTLEKKFSRALIAHPLFEKYRMLSFVNTIKVSIDGEPERFLTADERKSACEAFMVKTAFKFEKIAKLLRKKHFRNCETSFNYRDDHSCSPSALIYQLQDLLDCEDIFSWKHTYKDVKKHEKQMDYQTVFDGLKYFQTDFDGDDLAFKRFAVERVGLSDDAAEKFMNVKVSEGYAKYSLYAIRKIVPFLEEGFIEPYAVFLAKVPEIMGREYFELHKNEIFVDFQQCLDDYNWEKHNLSLLEKRRLISLNNRFKQVLEEKWRISPDKLASLYEFKESSNYTEQLGAEMLPHIDLGMIYNPMVHRSLTVLRRLINDLRKSGKIDVETEIHIELAREVNDKNTRMAVYTEQKENERLRKQAIEMFVEKGIENPTEEQILRWRLWEEQNHVCIYTGRKIGASEIFTNDMASLDREHTIPRSVGGENNLANLTLCDSRYNRDVKIGKLPSECPNYDSSSSEYKFTIQDGLKAAGFDKNLVNAEKDYAEIMDKLKKIPASSPSRATARQRSIILRRKRDYWREKMMSFEISREELKGDFSRRQLMATGVMTRHALQFLKSTYPKVYANNGTVTSFARKEWGLQEQYEKKVRLDHVHHIIDALVIAALDRESLNSIARAYHDNDHSPDCELARPWHSFPDDVHRAVEGVLVKKLVSHNETKQAKRNSTYLVTPIADENGKLVHHVKSSGDTVRGQLHDQTWYGRILDKDKTIRTVLRTVLDPGNFAKITDFDSIVDENVRAAIKEQVSLRMQEGKSLKDAILAGFRMKTKSGNYDGPAIKKVRVYRDDVVSLLAIKSHTYVSEQEHKRNYYAATAKGGNFMVALYRAPDTPDNDRTYIYDLVTLWEWAKDHRSEDYIPPEQRTDKGVYIGAVNPGVAVLFYRDSPDELKKMSNEQLSRRLYFMTEFKKSGQMCLRWHREARAKNDVEDFMKKIKKVNSKIEWDSFVPLLRLSKKTYQNHTLFAGIDFDISTDGKIIFRE